MSIIIRGTSVRFFEKEKPRQILLWRGNLLCTQVASGHMHRPYPSGSVSILLCAQVASSSSGRRRNSSMFQFSCARRLRLQTADGSRRCWYFNSHVRAGFVSKNEQKPLLITINHAQPYCLNSSAHSVLLAIKGDLLLLHRCEPPYKIM